MKSLCKHSMCEEKCNPHLHWQGEVIATVVAVDIPFVVSPEQGGLCCSCHELSLQGMSMGKLLGMGCVVLLAATCVQVGLVVIGMLVPQLPQLPALIYWLRSSYLQQ